ncbi:MAG: hypothetical protein J6Y42_00890 [Bacilli bacterium]|nr:hypothetical protein [Bacilli bacterium]
MNNDTATKKKRGRPKKPKPELPKFKNDRDIRKYILGIGLELSLELKEQALKKNNIKKPNVSNAKNQQYKTALSSLKIVNDILKDKQLDNLEEKVQMMEEGITSSIIKNGYHEERKEEDLPDELIENLQKLKMIEEELEKMNTD